MEANLLDSIGNFGSGESNILKSPGKAAIEKRIGKGLAARGSEFRFSVYGSRGGLAITHSGAR
jgi:hypothetical protein